MFGKAVSLSISGIVFVLFVSWVSSKFLTADLDTTSSQNVENNVNSSGGLIVPNNDPRFNGGN